MNVRVLIITIAILLSIDSFAQGARVRQSGYTESDIPLMCHSNEEYDSGYSQFFELSGMSGVQPDGFIVSFPLFIQGDRDSHVLLSKNPWANDEGYEIVFGGWGNSRIIVRKATGEELKFGQVNQVLDANKKRVFLIQITNDGDIIVYRKTDAGEYQRALQYNDPNPVSVQHVGFGSFYGKHRVNFYFDCSFDFDIPNRLLE